MIEIIIRFNVPIIITMIIVTFIMMPDRIMMKIVIFLDVSYASFNAPAIAFIKAGVSFTV